MASGKIFTDKNKYTNNRNNDLNQTVSLNKKQKQSSDFEKKITKNS